MTADRRHRRTSARALLALLAVAASTAAAQEPSARAPSLRADPAALTLGPDARTSLVLEGASGAAPIFSSNVGAVERVRRDGERFRAEFVAPREAHPQVAIVCAVLADGIAWTAIPLSGRGVAVAHTEPKARLTVTIAGRPFGPVRADAGGEASVPVIVPPGVSHAYHGEEALDLHVPPTLHVHALADRPLVRADREEEIVLVVLAV